jgi:hypothetical protein
VPVPRPSRLLSAIFTVAAMMTLLPGGELWAQEKEPDGGAGTFQAMAAPEGGRPRSGRRRACGSVHPTLSATRTCELASRIGEAIISTGVGMVPEDGNGPPATSLPRGCTCPMLCLYSSEGAIVRRERTARKNLRLSQAKLDRARRILGTKTETETVEQALDLVAFREEVAAGVRRMVGSRSLRDVFRDEE